MKKINISSILFFILLMCAIKINGQTSEKEKSIDLIRKGIEFHDKEKYDDALIEFKKVHRNDSNFYLAGLEILNTFLTTKKDEEGIVLCNELLKLKNDYTPNILIFKADFLDNLKKYDEAQKIFEQGIKDYPLNNSFVYEIGVLKLRQKKYAEAYTQFIKSIHINPMHASSHYQLFSLAYRQNNITCAMLAAQFFLIVENSTKRAGNLVIDIEKISKQELVIDTAISIPELNNDNDFSEFESIIKSKAALGEKYKSKTDLNYDLIKQIQLLTENISKYKDVKGFYNEFYGVFFAELNAKKYLEPYVYHTLVSMKIEKITKWIEKNKSDVTKFNDWAYNYVCNNLANYNENLNNQTVKVPHYFYYNKISAAGLKNDKNDNIGYWNYYYNNGIKKSEGAFINGKRDDKWRFYYKTGDIEKEITYKNGFEVVYKTFYLNNNPKLEFNLINNQIVGEGKSYFSNGNVRISKEYIDGKISGIEKNFYRNGSAKYSVKNNEDILLGDFTEYYDNGKLYYKSTFVNNKQEGPSKQYYNNDKSTLQSEGVYLKNKPVGEWKFYHKSGKLSSTGKYNNDGEKEELWLTYFDNGNLKSEENYSDNKYNGTQKYYDYDKILWEEYVYKKGKLLEYRAYKKDATKICDNKVNGKNFKLIQYYPNGIIRREGSVSDGDLDGIWKTFSTYGVLTDDVNYKEGKNEGKYIEYFANGKTHTQRDFKNNQENGFSKYYFINGNLQKEGEVINDNKQGYWKHYRIDGSLEKIYYYTNNEVDGWNVYYDVSGKLNNEELYKEGCIIKVTYNDTTGNLYQNIDLPGGTGIINQKYEKTGASYYYKEFKKDYAEGLSTVYYPDGKILNQVNNIKGKKEGNLIRYNEFGKITNETPYFNNEIEGKDIDYFDNGKIESEYNYDDGEKNGKCIVYHDNGKIYKELIYSDGNVQGASNVYDAFGELICQRNFLNDLLVNYTYKDASGNLVKPLEIKKDDSKVLCYFQNGKKSMEANYTNGDLNGKRNFYYSNGQLASEENFVYDYENETTKTYYPNGTLKTSEGNYFGTKHGKFQTFYENGKLKSEINYKYGNKHGWSMYYDEKGQLLKALLSYNGEPYAYK